MPRRVKIKSEMTAIAIGIFDDRVDLGIDRILGIVAVMVVWCAPLTLISVNHSIVIDKRNSENDRVFYRRLNKLPQHSLKNITTGTFTSMVTSGKDNAFLAFSQGNARNRTTFTTLA